MCLLLGCQLVANRLFVLLGAGKDSLCFPNPALLLSNLLLMLFGLLSDSAQLAFDVVRSSSLSTISYER